MEEVLAVGDLPDEPAAATLRRGPRCNALLHAPRVPTATPQPLRFSGLMTGERDRPLPPAPELLWGPGGAGRAALRPIVVLSLPCAVLPAAAVDALW